jgi:hypothetical protein
VVLFVADMFCAVVDEAFVCCFFFGQSLDLLRFGMTFKRYYMINLLR